MEKSTRLQDLLENNTIAAAPELVQQEDEKAVRCLACAHRCHIRPGHAGVCRVRFNREGQLRVPGGYVASLRGDPVEKKPFFHVYPGENALSFGMLGCNFHCDFCQNWVSSQVLRDERAIAFPHLCTATQIVDSALRENAPLIVSTYNEPLISADWAMQIFAPAREAGLHCGFVSNGYATPEVLSFLRPCVEIYKVDLKSFNEKNYQHLGGKLSHVLDSIERLKVQGFWVEIVTLVVPNFNDSTDELQQIAGFIAQLSPDIPWHVTAFHPDYNMQGPASTTAQSLQRAHSIGKEAGLHYVYAGNLPNGVPQGENTYCPHCQTLLIERYGFAVLSNNLRNDHCPKCDTAIAGFWKDTAIQ